MDKYEAVLKLLLEAVEENAPPASKQNLDEIPVGVSNRHIHLSQIHLNTLFGEGYQLTKIKDLSQPGQFACKETVIICGAKGAIEKVRVLGPVRNKTQIEILAGDCFKLGVPSPVRVSGDLSDTPGITVIGPKGSVQTCQGLMVAQRHIHMTPADAQHFGVKDGDTVCINVEGARGGIYGNVAVRVNDASKLECHIDTEEANAMSLGAFSKITIVQ